jgi:antitoxin (DNA-binding transcriptional repressor) of toxin-antitoxin stability system
MRTVTVQEAKTQLSALLHAVEDGEEIEIRPTEATRLLNSAACSLSR